MLEEQRKTVDMFRNSFPLASVPKLVVYGTGINAEAVVKNCGDYPIVGLMDAAKTGEELWGLKVLSQQEVLEAGVKLVVVAARPAVHAIIYKRIAAWSVEHGIRVLDIQGGDIALKTQTQVCQSPWFEKSYDQLQKEIDRHEVISFDVFDTLLTRRAYGPEDIFSLLDLECKNRYPFCFSVERKRAEAELLKRGNPNIDQIYQQLRQNHPCLTQKDCALLLEQELQKERQVLTLRHRMAECLNYCSKQGKNVCLVSDMYLPEAILKNLLAQFGITQYDRVFVSCDYGVSKKEGLFQVMKRAMGDDRSFLHIGDHPIADGQAAEENGIDSVLILPPVRMMELSAFAPLLVHSEGLPGRIMLGLIMAEAFNDPFVLYRSNGRPLVRTAFCFGYLFAAPLAVSFVVWLLEKVSGEEDALLLFAARDGWIMQQVYHLLADTFQLSALPQSQYLLISRNAISLLDKPVNRKKRELYLEYLRSLTVETRRKIYFFDFMSKGTCQSYLETLIGQACEGLYVQWSKTKDRAHLNIHGYFAETNAQDTDRHIFALCDFLECIFTSFDPSFTGLDERGCPVYEQERRTKEQLDAIREMHRGILEYSQYFSKILGAFPTKMPPSDFADTMLGMMGAAYSRVAVPELERLMLDDITGGDKNTGRDALL